MSELMASLITCNASCLGNNGSSNETEAEDEDTFLPSPLIVLLSFMCLLIVAVNGLVIFLIYKKRSLRTITNMFLASLALSDLMSALLGIPLLVVCLVRDVIKVCLSSSIIIRFTAISSVCHVLLIACDRYIFIVQLNKNLQQRNRSVLQEWRGRSVLLITMVIFAGCWLPFFLMVLDAHMESSTFSPLPVFLERLLIFVGFIPQLLNPVLCTLAKKDFRHALKEVFLPRQAPLENKHNVRFHITRNQFGVNHNVECE